MTKSLLNRVRKRLKNEYETVKLCSIKRTVYDDYDRRTVINGRARRKRSDFSRDRCFKTRVDTEYLFRIMSALSRMFSQ